MNGSVIKVPNDALRRSAGSSRLDLSWRLAITFAAVAVLFLAPTPQSMARSILGLTVSLVERGSVVLDIPRGMDVAERDGKILSGMPPGASILAVPIYVVFRPWLAHLPMEQKLVWLYVLCTGLLAIPAAAGTVYLACRLLRDWGATAQAAALTAGLLAFGTMHFGYATGYYKKTLAASCLLAVFFLFSRISAHSRPIPAAGLAGALSGLAVALDYPTVVIVICLGGYLCSRKPGGSTVAACAAGMMVALLPLLAYHQAAFGSPWATPYGFRIHPEGNILGVPDPATFLFLGGTLVAASPCLVWAARGWWRAARDRALTAEMWTVAGIIGSTLLLFSCWSSYYPHEASFGSRLLLPVLPFAALPMVFGLPERVSPLAGLVAAWSIGATLLAAQAVMIPSGTLPPWYAAKILATSWGSGPLFAERLAAWLDLPTLHRAVSESGVRPSTILRTAEAGELLRLVAGQAAIKALSVSATVVIAGLLWVVVWRPYLRRQAAAPPNSRSSLFSIP